MSYLACAETLVILGLEKMHKAVQKGTNLVVLVENQV